jgi:hypothetical protein
VLKIRNLRLSKIFREETTWKIRQRPPSRPNSANIAARESTLTPLCVSSAEAASYQRNAALKKLKRIMEGLEHEEQQ